MKWSPEAEDAVKKVPFFVRKKVRTRVEQVAAEKGTNRVTLNHVNTAKDRFLKKMESEVKGYQVDSCFGSGGCPNRANISDTLVKKIEELLRAEDILGFLKKTVTGSLKFHHEFRVTLSDCPNACSQPQIKDIGIIGADKPEITDETCSVCEACVSECKEKAIMIHEDAPVINFDLCLACGKCMNVCPTGTIRSGEKGFKIMIGGKLGRHPALAKELPGIYSEQELINIVKRCISFYKENSINGERFGSLDEKTSFYDRLIKMDLK